ncbi:uncharacterized protein LOC129957685 [Argiope bruennichi]|uniref:uncharacterized protein LOC129957685 n=1 Tax=Argiope bruennichi TaxID=94029 RepID=UPI002494FBEB|nr:uncharacterized protein LOC129957685 [Argiope bruennichi]
MKSDEIFEKVFCSNVKELILNGSERVLAKFVYRAAVEEIRANRKDPDDNNVDDAKRKINLNIEIEATVKIFKCVVDLFKASQAAKSAFLDNFDRWSSSRKSNIKSLRKIADDIQTDKFNCDISKVVGSSVGVAGGIALGLSFIPFLAPITVPLLIGGGIASASGAGVVIGTTSEEIKLLKKNLEEAKNLIQKEKSSSSMIDVWFNHTKEMREEIESLVESRLLKEMVEDLKRFQDEMKKKTSFTVDELKNRFNQLLKSFIRQMHKFSKKIAKFGDVIAPLVMTFVIVFCLLRQHNRTVIHCIGQMYRLMAKNMSVSDVDVTTGQVLLSVSRGLTAASRIFAAANIALDVLTMVQSSIDIHNRTEVEQAKQIREAAVKLEEERSFIERVYDEVKKWRYID